MLYNNDSGNPSANFIANSNKPRDIKTTLETIIAQRKSQQILQPVIIKSTQTASTDSIQQSPINKPLPPSGQYNSDAERELLNTLLNQKKITAPEGYSVKKEGKDEK